MNQLASPNQYFLLENLGCIRLRGEDTLKFLQGQITINAENLIENQLILGSVCNPQGRCVGLFWAGKQADDVVLFQLKETINDTIAHLSKYAVFFKTEISDISDQKVIWGNVSSQALDHSEVDSTIKKHADIFTQADGLVSLVMADKSAKAEINNSPKVSEGADAFYLQLTAHQIPWLTSESQNEFLPHNLNLPDLGAVDFKKGCFTGQEVIARMQYKGQLKSHIQRFRSQQKMANVQPLAKVFADGKKAGEVICGALGTDGMAEFLVLLKDKYLECEIFRMQDENGPILELVIHS